MSTDLAEFVGAAIGMNLLFGVPLLVAGLMTGVVAFGILALQALGFRKFELAISALLGTPRTATQRVADDRPSARSCRAHPTRRA